MVRSSPFPRYHRAQGVFRTVLFLMAASAAQMAAGQTPHPAVVRIVVAEGPATSYGSGTLVDVRDQYGLVVTNWHVVRDATGQIEVVFPDGFRSAARPVKFDADWDLAALVIWRPHAAPVPLAAIAPQPGELLTIAGYGQGSYRQATGRCTQYLAPRIDFPNEMVELDVEARQGDSGGPIFNGRGELAGVLFGASYGTTMGSYAGRVGGFLASVAPELGQADEVQIAAAPSWDTATIIDVTNQFAQQSPPHSPDQQSSDYRTSPDGRRAHQFEPNTASNAHVAAVVKRPPALATSATKPDRAFVPAAVPTQGVAEGRVITWHDIAGESLFDQAKTVLAAIGLLALGYHVIRWTST